MQDRGEKIVTLAREILRSNEAPAPVLSVASPQQITLSFKVLCLATILTAIGSSAVTSWVIETQRPLNHYERTEIEALIFYVARQKGLNEDDLRREVLTQLKVPNLEAMMERDYIVARTYLQNKAD